MNLLALLILTVFSGVVYYNFILIISNVKKCYEYSSNIPAVAYSEPISIIKPMKGCNEYTYSNFTSWINQDNQSNLCVEYIFSFDEGDECIKIAQQIPFNNKKILSNHVLEGFSGKMSALVYALEYSSNELVIFSDGDTKAELDTLDKIMHQFESGAGIVTCLAVYNNAKNIWSRLYASIWNLAEIGIVGPSIINRGDQVVGNTFAIYKKTLEEIGGLENFRNFLAEDIAIGKTAYEKNIDIKLGPLIESPVGKISFSDLIDRYSRAALYAITMRGLRNNWHFVLLFSYFLVLFPPLIFLGQEIIFFSVLLALGRLFFASYFWFIVTGEMRVFVECFLGDLLFMLTYVKVLFFRTASWSGRKYRVDSEGKLTSIIDNSIGS